MTMQARFVAYYRVSTEKQGRSGLGLDAQREAVAGFLRGEGARAKLMAEYTEVESGKRNDRPQLARAIEHAKLTGSVLLIAKLDRLSRDAHFLLGLEKAGIEFVAADMPSANRLTVGIMAMVAEDEGRRISARTKAALAAAKARGTKLGNPNGAAHLKGRGNTEAVQAITQGARERAEALRGTLAALKAEGVTSAQGTARALNERGVLTARGGLWTARSVLNVLVRLSEPIAGPSGQVA